MSEVEKALSVLRETIPAGAPAQKTTSWNPSDLGIGFGNGADPDTWLTLTKMLGLTPQNAISLVEAFQISGVLACTDVISQDIAKSTLRMYRRLPDGGRKLLAPADHPMAEMLALEPNSDHTWGEFTEMVVRQLSLTQNAYIVKGADREGAVTELLPLLTMRVTIWIDPDTGDKYYSVTRGSNFERAILRKYPARIPDQNMIHIRLRMVDGLLGYSTLVAGNDAMALARDISGYQRRLYSSDGRLHGAIELPKEAEFNNDSFARLRSQVRDLWRKTRTDNEPFLLEGGATFKPIVMNANDAQVALVRDQAVQEVASLFRVPPYKIGRLDQSKYSNMEAQEKAYLDDTLIPVASRCEDVLAKNLLTRKERLKFFFEYDRDEMAALDPATRSNIAVRNATAGIFTFDEARGMQGKDPLPNGAGKVRALPVNYTLIDENNKVVLQGAKGQPQGPNGEQTPENEGGNPEETAPKPPKPPKSSENGNIHHLFAEG